MGSLVTRSGPYFALNAATKTLFWALDALEVVPGGVVATMSRAGRLRSSSSAIRTTSWGSRGSIDAALRALKNATLLSPLMVLKTTSGFASRILATTSLASVAPGAGTPRRELAEGRDWS
jgi:hypothetical protein